MAKRYKTSGMRILNKFKLPPLTAIVLPFILIFQLIISPALLSHSPISGALFLEDNADSNAYASPCSDDIEYCAEDIFIHSSVQLWSDIAGLITGFSDKLCGIYGSKLKSRSPPVSAFLKSAQMSG